MQAKSGTGKTCVFSTIALDSLILENSVTQVRAIVFKFGQEHPSQKQTQQSAVVILLLCMLLFRSIVVILSVFVSKIPDLSLLLADYISAVN